MYYTVGHDKESNPKVKPEWYEEHQLVKLPLQIQEPKIEGKKDKGRKYLFPLPILPQPSLLVCGVSYPSPTARSAGERFLRDTGIEPASFIVRTPVFEALSSLHTRSNLIEKVCLRNLGVRHKTRNTSLKIVKASKKLGKSNLFFLIILISICFSNM